MSSFYYEKRQSFASDASRPITYAVQRLIIATVIVFAAQLIVAVPVAGLGLAALDPEFWLALNPALLKYGAVYQLVTYVFLHGGLMHLFFNMLVLYFFGPDLERILSTRQFFRFYLLCGAVGGLLQFGLALLQHNTAPTIGASGAVLGVLTAYAVAYPKREMYLFPIPFPLYMWAVAVLFFVLSLTSDPMSGGTAWAAHAGGMICGFVYMKFAPKIRVWFEKSPRANRAAADEEKVPMDTVGDAVDNIFRFDDEKKRRK